VAETAITFRLTPRELTTNGIGPVEVSSSMVWSGIGEIGSVESR
jgi:hypothetical protein